MISAGTNYFCIDPNQKKWVSHRPVFYEILRDKDVADDFPQELFRPNFRGIIKFLDEPANILMDKYPEDTTFTQALDMLGDHIHERHSGKNRHYSKHLYRSSLNKAGIDTGTLKLIEPAIPIWETVIPTTYYQLEIHPYGIMHESRWQLTDPNNRWEILRKINKEFETDIPLTPENLFLWHYAQLIGPARTFNARWGMSIYGQAESQMRLPSMKLAYELGATYIWFWTSDHSHHVPYKEQLALTEAFSKYTKSTPPRQQLLTHAKTVIVLPYGYTLPSQNMRLYRSDTFPLDRKNDLGFTYRQVLTPAIKQIEHCLKNNIPFDILANGKDFNPADYDHIIMIKEDPTATSKKPPF